MPWVIIGLAVLASRAQTLFDPVLGFDEQFYLLMADRMLHGALPYVDIWDRKPIGLFLIYVAAILPGGDPFVQYKLLAAACVAATAYVIYRAALRDAGRFGALVAALLYVFWLNFMDGEGGQPPVFYNLPMLLAALLVRRAADRRGPLTLCGLAAMLLVGLAIQTKYTAVFEGLFFGLMLMREGHRAWGPSRRLIVWTLAWAGCALVPTASAWGIYAALGHGDAFYFANFLSIFGRLPDPWSIQLAGLALIVAVIMPLAVIAVLAERQQQRGSFARYWAFAAALGLLVFGSFLSPGYAMPLIAPLCLCAAPWFSQARHGRTVAVMLLGLSLGGGSFVLAKTIEGKGNRTEAMAVAAAARPRHGGCIWVYDGYPALYMLTGSCLPTKWPFPGHLNTADEASPHAIGVEPAAEVRRILATRPESIVDDYPAYHLGNRVTRALVQAELARSYRLVARVETGTGRFRLIYRRRELAE